MKGEWCILKGEKVLFGRGKRCSLKRYKSSLKGNKCILEGKGFNGGGKYSVVK